MSTAHEMPRQATHPHIAPVRRAGGMMLDTEQLPWTPFALPGTYFKLLHLDDNHGKATLLLKVPDGVVTDIHRHLAAVEAFVVKGSFSYEEGTVKTGGYVYEPGGVVHQPESHGELILFVVAYGPVMGYDEQGNPAGLIDNDLMYQLAADNGAAGHIRRD
ncbi:MAG: 2,4'-dihydroxyacetophenone dioxygenase family protein [Ectothiorhodospiraceae bacterium]|nr:2,4'-dihydroxyacetophenone dioxygenase family protein [Ectothiorhodospiraceae bacterium]